ncbi:MAG: hypothetical protein WBG01_14690 [Bacteroidota bacterium]
MIVRALGSLTVASLLGLAIPAAASPAGGSSVAQAEGGPKTMRPGFSAGMGVSYVNPTDIVNLVNSTPGTLDRVSEFRAAVEFYGGFSVPLSEEWALKVEYAYLLGSYNVASAFGPAEYTYVTHMPSIIGQYVLVNEGVYNVKVGFGGGYHFGSLSQRIANLEDTYSGSGPGVLADLEANTAFGDHLYGNLGAIVRWEFVGGLTNGNGQSPRATVGSSATTLNFFGIGARLGFTYYF